MRGILWAPPRPLSMCQGQKAAILGAWPAVNAGAPRCSGPEHQPLLNQNQWGVTGPPAALSPLQGLVNVAFRPWVPPGLCDIGAGPLTLVHGFAKMPL